MTVVLGFPALHTAVVEVRDILETEYRRSALVIVEVVLTQENKVGITCVLLVEQYNREAVDGSTYIVFIACTQGSFLCLCTEFVTVHLFTQYVLVLNNSSIHSLVPYTCNTCIVSTR